MWSFFPVAGTNLFYTLDHEIGHALGLFHSDNADSLMFAYDRGYIPNFKLPQDDIRGIQDLYGEIELVRSDM